MALFEVAGDSSNDPGRRMSVGKTPKGEEVFFWIRRVPAFVYTEIEKRHPYKRKFDRRTSSWIRRRSRHEEKMAQYEQLAYALRRIEGPLFSVTDEKGAELFSTLSGKDLAVGDDVIFDTLTDKAKFAIFDYLPVAAAEVLRCINEINRADQVDEAEEDENLSTGSSGS